MPDTPTPTPPQNVISIPIPSVGGITDNAAFRQLLNAAITIVILYAAAKFGVPIVPPTAPAPVAPVVSQ